MRLRSGLWFIQSSWKASEKRPESWASQSSSSMGRRRDNGGKVTGGGGCGGLLSLLLPTPCAHCSQPPNNFTCRSTTPETYKTLPPLDLNVYLTEKRTNVTNRHTHNEISVNAHPFKRCYFPPRKFLFIPRRLDFIYSFVYFIFSFFFQPRLNLWIHLKSRKLSQVGAVFFFCYSKHRPRRNGDFCACFSRSLSRECISEKNYINFTRIRSWAPIMFANPSRDVNQSCVIPIDDWPSNSYRSSLFHALFTILLALIFSLYLLSLLLFSYPISHVVQPMIQHLAHTLNMKVKSGSHQSLPSNYNLVKFVFPLFHTLHSIHSNISDKVIIFKHPILIDRYNFHDSRIQCTNQQCTDTMLPSILTSQLLSLSVWMSHKNHIG